MDSTLEEKTVLEDSNFPEELDKRYREDLSISEFVQFCAGLAEVSKKGLKLERLDSKLFYKLRHNTFKTLCLKSLGLESYKERPFSDLPELGIDSIRTPDFLMSLGDKILLIEFTVSNRIQSVYTNKGFFTKYDEEIKKSLIPIDDFYFFVTLEGGVDDVIQQITTVSERYDFKISNSVREEMEDYLETIKAVTSYFLDFSPELLTMNTYEFDIQLKSDKIEAPNRIPYNLQLVGKKATKGVRIKSLLSRNFKKLLIQARKKSSFSNYKIKINFITGICYIVEDNHGLEKSELINILDMQSDRILLYIEIIGDHYIENGIFQDVPIDIENLKLKDRKQLSIKVYDTETLENRLFKTCMSQDMVTVADRDLSENYVKVGDLYKNIQNKMKKESKVAEYLSSPFIFYPSDFLKKGSFDVEIKSKSSIVNKLIEVAMGKDIPKSRVIDRDINYEAMLEYNRFIAKEGMPLKIKYRMDLKKYRYMSNKKFNLALIENPDLEDVKSYRDGLNKYKTLVSEHTRKFYQNRIRINLKENHNWENDTEHFRRLKNGYDLYPERDLTTLKNEYDNFLIQLMETSCNSTIDNVFSDTKPLGKTLADNCTQMYTSIKEIEDMFKTTRLAHSTLLTSQLCYTLSFYSMIKLNKDDFVYDNLGYKNVLLMVKGGKKAISTRTSRFFRLLMPITSQQKIISESATNEFYHKDGQDYLLTPWRMLRLPYLKKGIELYANFGNYYVSGILESGLNKFDFEQFISIKILLMFSQKRKIEVWSSLLRYLFFNSLGTHTDVLNLIPDMVMIPTDSLSYLLQNLFVENYSKIYTSMSVNLLYDIYWGTTVANMDLTAERFEENLFMTRAPFNPVNEHLKNLKSVIDTHKYYLNYVGSLDSKIVLDKTSVEIGDNYFSRLEENDFNFDPAVCQMVGDFAGQYIASSKTKADLLDVFNSHINKSYTEIATGKGMRDQDGIFWGEKGHDVVNKKLSFDIQEILKDFPKTPTEFRKLISTTEISFLTKINSCNAVRLEFDMKDKEQYKGSREIYVMTELTKLLQNPLEKFFATLCKCFPNELIHKPSGQRPKYIHSKIFEQDYSGQFILYCTMDCRKWAPRSNLWKYYYFVKGMESYLPETFYNYFMKFWNLMFTKVIRIQNKYIELLKTNTEYEAIEDLLTHREDGDYELQMPYSFMMGIFNYLSSLLHAASQMFFSEKFAPKLRVTCNFIAHSDDSGGIIVGKNQESCLRAYRCYEKFQRTLNHLMSRKKCVLSNKGFEMISIMYNSKRFIPMTHKFITNVALDLKAAGWYKDITTVVGKVVDLFNNGGTYLQCYCLMLSMSELLRKSYHIPRHEYLSHVPLSMGGIFNYHPIHLILLGSKSQETLLDYIEEPIIRSSRINAYYSLCGDYNIGIPGQFNYTLSYYKVHPSKIELDEENKIKLSALSTLPIKTTVFDNMKHQNRLYEQSYVFALTGVDATQTFFATLFYPCKIVINSETSISLKSVVSTYLSGYLIDPIHEIQTYPMVQNIHYDYIKQVESMKFDYEKVRIVSTKSCKPLKYNTVENFGLRISQENMMYLSAIEKWPEIKNIFYAPERFEVLKDYLLRSLPGDTADKLKFLKNFDPSEKEDSIRSAYLFMPSGVSIDTPQRFVAYTLLYCTRRYFISSQKPQLYTPSEFGLENMLHSDYKHQFLIYKLMEKGQDQDRLVCNFKSCEKCSQGTYYQVEKYKEYLNAPEMRDFVSILPFIDYATSQIRGRNIWFSECDFDLYAINSKIESRQTEGVTRTVWYVEDPDDLSNLWNMYRMFCNTRGINYDRPSYQETGFGDPKVAFNDFNSPYIPSIYQMAMVLPNSKIIIKSTIPPKVHRRGNKFYVSDRVVDFKIHSIYDLSLDFFKNHNLETIKDLIYEKEFELDSKVLKNYFSESKLYKMVLNDERHSSINPNKYFRSGLLGEPGSFTRALAISDGLGETKYRSSTNPSYHTKGAIEFDKIEGVPVLDMFGKLSLARLTAYEKMSFDKVMAGSFLTGQDKQNLSHIRKKLGIEALGMAISSYKHVFQGMVAGSIIKIPPQILRDLLSILITSLHDCMATEPVSYNQSQYTGNRKSFWVHVRNLLISDKDLVLLPLLLTRGILRAKYDNPHKFWSLIRDNVMLSCLSITKEYLGNLNSMITGMLSCLKRGNISIRSLFFDEDNHPRFRNLALTKTTYVDRNLSYEYSNSVRMGFNDEPFLADDEYLDLYTSNDDIEDIELQEREWDGDVLQVIGDNKNSILYFMDETCMNNFEKVRIACPSHYLCFPWLGRGNFYKDSINGVDYFISEFPGSDKPPKEEFWKLKDIKFIQDKELVMDKIDDDEIKTIESKHKYVPHTIKDREVAVQILESQNIFLPQIADRLFPKQKQDIMKMIETSIDMFDLFEGDDIQDIIRKRGYGKFHLPGFQGVLQDPILMSELVSLFGENAYHIITGHVNLGEASYKMIMKSIKRLYGRSGIQDRSLLLFLTSLLLDTVPSERSDNWFLDIINGILNEIDDRVNPDDEEMMLPVNPTYGNLEYKEKDLFD